MECEPAPADRVARRRSESWTSLSSRPRSWGTAATWSMTAPWALVIDPQRDTDRVEAAAPDAGVDITHVAETHVHNDYLTGGLTWPGRTAQSTWSTPPTPCSSSAQPITDGQSVQVGSFSVKAVATPGHTHTHLSFIVDDGEQQAVFSGGSLLYGSVGRTDLVGAADTPA